MIVVTSSNNHSWNSGMEMIYSGKLSMVAESVKKEWKNEISKTREQLLEQYIFLEAKGYGEDIVK